MTTCNAGNRFHALFLESKHHIQKSRVNLVGKGTLMMSKKYVLPELAHAWRRRISVNINCCCQISPTNLSFLPHHMIKKRIHPDRKTFANVRYISKFDAQICRSQLARKTPVGCKEGKLYHPCARNLVSMPHSSPVIFPIGMWPCIGMI